MPKRKINILDKIRTLLFNYDLTLVYLENEIQVRKNLADSYSGLKWKYTSARFVQAIIEQERYEILLERTKAAKESLIQNVEMVLERYTPIYAQVYKMVLISGYDYDIVAKELGLTLDGVKKIVDRLKEELIDFVCD